ncbi:hypothetical protein HZH66_009631 [Vespula vulgaris]|uniref:Uncharacterized protein n=1 Tax=Vespula vulgaris TaxID=7454 RepID=A0A834JPD1_VESVU|nr:hypothetical protein HZH66_009631 [Vespula vulgaris]
MAVTDVTLFPNTKRTDKHSAIACDLFPRHANWPDAETAIAAVAGVTLRRGTRVSHPPRCRKKKEEEKKEEEEVEEEIRPSQKRSPGMHERRTNVYLRAYTSQDDDDDDDDDNNDDDDDDDGDNDED